MNDPNRPALTCPWWLLFTFDNPLRGLLHRPKKMLQPYVKTGDVVLDVGCGMGYFSLGLAGLVGPQGRVVAADLQPQMLAGLVRRARRAGLEERIHPHQCAPDRVGVNETFDFVLAFWMVHEVGAREAFLGEIFAALKPGGKFLLVEPRIHVSGQDFECTRNICLQTGFQPVETVRVSASRAVLFATPAG